MVHIQIHSHLRHLSDTDNDGQLNLKEFCIAMKLINLKREKKISELPNTLPKELLDSVRSIAIASYVKKIILTVELILHYLL